jgi:hypothetical protein
MMLQKSPITKGRLFSWSQTTSFWCVASQPVVVRAVIQDASPNRISLIGKSTSNQHHLEQKAW